MGKDKLEIQIGYMDSYNMVVSTYLINEHNEITSKRHSNNFNTDAEINLSDLLSDNFVIVSSV
jgi:hypothetical protein